MHHLIPSRRTRVACAVPALAAIAAIAVPYAAAAAPVEKSIVTSTASGGMTYAGTSAANVVKVSLGGSSFTIDDSVPISPGAGCAAVAGDATKATCVAFKLPDGSLKPFNLFGRAGKDTLMNASPASMLAHGEAGNDTLRGGPRADFFDGGEGADDLVSYEDKAARVVVSLDGKADDGVAGEGDNATSTVENIVGGPRDDVLTGNDADNNLFGEDGGDVLIGGLGTDALLGQGGSDVLLSNGQFSLEQARDGARDFLSGSLDDEPNGESDTCAGSHGEDSYDDSCDLQ